MTKDYLRYLVYTDFFRLYKRDLTKKEYLSLLMGKKIFSQGFRLVFCYRHCKYFFLNRSNNPLHRTILFLKRSYWTRRYRKLCEKFGIEFPVDVDVGKGFIVWHVNGIVVRRETEFGDNCQLFQQVTIGKIHGNEKRITIGNSVSIGAGAKIIGITNIGDCVAIGANSVITHNVDDCCSVAGVPGRVLHSNKKFNWARTDYLSFDDWKKH